MNKKIPLVQVHQWMKSWEEADYSLEVQNNKPPEYFYVGSVSIKTLRRLAGVSRRQLSERKAKNPAPGYQRGHESERSEKIARYLRYGYPLSSQKSLDPDSYTDLIHPGWLPTAILVNVIKEGESRRRGGKNLSLDPNRAVKVVRENGQIFLSYPAGENEYEKISGEQNFLEPLEVIDGQHRLYAVDLLSDMDDEYQVPNNGVRSS